MEFDDIRVTPPSKVPIVNSSPTSSLPTIQNDSITIPQNLNFLSNYAVNDNKTKFSPKVHLETTSPVHGHVEGTSNVLLEAGYSRFTPTHVSQPNSTLGSSETKSPADACIKTPCLSADHSSLVRRHSQQNEYLPSTPLSLHYHVSLDHNYVAMRPPSPEPSFNRSVLRNERGGSPLHNGHMSMREVVVETCDAAAASTQHRTKHMPHGMGGLSTFDKHDNYSLTAPRPQQPRIRFSSTSKSADALSQKKKDKAERRARRHIKRMAENKRRHSVSFDARSSPRDSDKDSGLDGDEDYSNSITRCICGFLHDDGYMIQCDKCKVWQHVECMGLRRGHLPKFYFCEQCEPRAVNVNRARLFQQKKKHELEQRTSSDSDTINVEVHKKKKKKKNKNGKKKRESHQNKRGNDSPWNCFVTPWTDSYEEAVSNRLSAGVLAAIRSSTFSDDKDFFVPEFGVRNYQSAFVLQNRKGIEAVRNMGANEYIAEFRGDVSLLDAYDMQSFYRRLQPFVLFCWLEHVPLVVNASSYGTDSRFVRRSCCPNAEVHCSLEDEVLSVRICSTTSINKGMEITIPFDYDPLKCEYAYECACSRANCSILLRKQEQEPVPQRRKSDASMDREKRRRSKSDSGPELPMSPRVERKQAIIHAPPPQKAKKVKLSPLKISKNENQMTEESRVVETPKKVKPPVDSTTSEEPPTPDKTQSREERKLLATIRAIEEATKRAERKKEQAADRGKKGPVAKKNPRGRSASDATKKHTAAARRERSKSALPPCKGELKLSRSSVDDQDSDDGSATEPEENLMLSTARSPDQASEPPTSPKKELEENDLKPDSIDAKPLDVKTEVVEEVSVKEESEADVLPDAEVEVKPETTSKSERKVIEKEKKSIKSKKHERPGKVQKSKKDQKNKNSEKSKEEQKPKKEEVKAEVEQAVETKSEEIERDGKVEEAEGKNKEILSPGDNEEGDGFYKLRSGAPPRPSMKPRIQRKSLKESNTPKRKRSSSGASNSAASIDGADFSASEHSNSGHFHKTKKHKALDRLPAEEDSNEAARDELVMCLTPSSRRIDSLQHLRRSTLPSQVPSRDDTSVTSTPAASTAPSFSSAKKRWLRQATVDTVTSAPSDAGTHSNTLTSPNQSRPSSPNHNDYFTPLKKRRLARASVDSIQVESDSRMTELRVHTDTSTADAAACLMALATSPLPASMAAPSTEPSMSSRSENLVAPVSATVPVSSPPIGPNPALAHTASSAGQSGNNQIPMEVHTSGKAVDPEHSNYPPFGSVHTASFPIPSPQAASNTTVYHDAIASSLGSPGPSPQVPSRLGGNKNQGSGVESVMSHTHLSLSSPVLGSPIASPPMHSPVAASSLGSPLNAPSLGSPHHLLSPPPTHTPQMDMPAARFRPSQDVVPIQPEPIHRRKLSLKEYRQRVQSKRDSSVDSETVSAAPCFPAPAQSASYTSLPALPLFSEKEVYEQKREKLSERLKKEFGITLPEDPKPVHSPPHSSSSHAADRNNAISIEDDTQAFNAKNMVEPNLAEVRPSRDLVHVNKEKSRLDIPETKDVPVSQSDNTRHTSFRVLNWLNQHTLEKTSEPMEVVDNVQRSRSVSGDGTLQQDQPPPLEPPQPPQQLTNLSSTLTPRTSLPPPPPAVITPVKQPKPVPPPVPSPMTEKRPMKRVSVQPKPGIAAFMALNKTLMDALKKMEVKSGSQQPDSGKPKMTNGTSLSDGKR